MSVHGLSRVFDGRRVVDDLSLSLAEGQVTCLLGPSGCGKTTTLRVIAGVDRQSEGEISTDGHLLSDGILHLPPEMRGIGLMFQDFALFPHLTVGSNVGFGLRGDRDSNRRRIQDLLGMMDLNDKIDRYPHELSGGEQQRVALARALAPEPGVMLMDEPFSGLDDRLRDEVRDETMKLLRDHGTSVLLVTHEPGEAMRVADEIALMRDGRIVQVGTPYTVYNNPVDLEAASFFSDINIITGKVNDFLCETPFGQFLVPGVDDGNIVDIAIRPQHIGVDFDRSGRGPNPTPERGTPARGVVTRARFLGDQSLVDFRMDYDGSLLKVSVPSVFLPEAGRPLWLTLRRDRCHVFPRS